MTQTATATSAAIIARDIRLTYPNGVRALDGATVTAAHGEFLAIIGPNGSGKSSLLRAICGLQSIDGGEVTLHGDALANITASERARRVALVPQALDVLPGYSVQDFVLMGRYAHLTGWRLYSQEDIAIARECLKSVNAEEFLERGMNEMSGGERQRVLIARALAQESKTILLDEPTSALDLKHQLTVYKLIDAMHRRGDKTVVVVTHDLNLASQFADRLILMEHGKVVSEGKPADVIRREVLEKVYGSELAFGTFQSGRPWVLPCTSVTGDR